MSEPSLNALKRAGQNWLWSILGGAGALLHFGTALLRLSTFFPYPKLMDFAAFYAGAWAVRTGISPYSLSPKLLETLRTQIGVSFSPPISPPIWLWLLQPLTFLHFSTAALIWLLVLLAFIAWSAFTLAQIARYSGWRQIGTLFILALTFGPVFLNLTLGQSGLFLLIAVLIIGQAIRAKTKDSSLWAAIAWVVAVGAKLFPLIWLGALPLLRRWRLFVLATMVVFLAFGLTTLLAPTASQDYWLRFLPERVFSYSEQVGIDDQSLVAWLDRLGRPQTFRVPGLSVAERHAVTWSPPWSVDPVLIRLADYSLVALLALVPIIVLLRAGSTEAEGAFYLWVLYGLIVFPHTERYNHVLLLPAMAWLWARSETFAQRSEFRAQWGASWSSWPTSWWVPPACPISGPSCFPHRGVRWRPASGSMLCCCWEGEWRSL